MAHIFLTGAVGCGKSTVVDKVLALTEGAIGGFRTSFGADRALPQRCLYLYPAGAPPLRDPAHVVAQYREDHPVALPGRFDALGVATLTGGAPALVIMDECGRLEGEATGFQAAVRTALDGDTPILGVLRQGFPGWTKTIAAHPTVELIVVTDENRDALPRQILSRLWQTAP